MRRIHVIFGTILIATVAFVALGLFYPFSFFNLTHEITISSDPHIIQNHRQDVKSISSAQKKGHTNKDTQVLVKKMASFLNQDWLAEQKYRFSRKKIMSQRNQAFKLVDDIGLYRIQNSDYLSQTADDNLLSYRNSLIEIIKDSNLILEHPMIQRNTLKTFIFKIRNDYETTTVVLHAFLKHLGPDNTA
ncbi:hypothetical protein M3N64_09785 [Sporolactobacillus sp. CPB3-1]|uniref:DUF4044 domain-containing protein n=1 Tax=Sporolactobacillus mangiferae TaxID=2940498 RepID=A0ABT0MBJ0_9BACL|nr:hypothetical protein [Sporolactobacillus mangiferae]MCL1632229.1 hypothetical protein [Sporolactobacillus mangiferae]